MRKILKIGNLLTISGLILVSCSVKEDRYECPCKFSADLEFCRGKWDEIALQIWGDETWILSKTLFPMAASKPQYEIRRGNWTVVACAGLTDSYIEGTEVIIKKGSQSDELYVYSSMLNATGEYAEAKVVPHKQFMNMTLDLSQYETGGYFSEFEIGGNVSGIGLLDLNPVPGEFKYRMSSRGKGEYVIRIPRQMDSSLTLTLSKDGEQMSSIPIGKYILQSGYDWSAEDLDDIKVTVNLNSAEVMIEVQEWDIIESFREYVI